MLPLSAAVVFLLLLLSAQPKAALVQLLCFCSLDPKAVNTTLVFNWDHDDVNLYKRDDLSVPLPLCSEIHPPQTCSCSVCLGLEKVFTVCLLENPKAKVHQEAPGKALNIILSDCPEFTGDPAPSAAPATSPALDSQLGAAVGISVALSVLLIAVFI